ncbi:MAG: Ldh family oxidoreductase [Candidatus Dormiibacterota bacterium]
MTRIPAERLTRIAVDALLARGVPEDDARTVATSLLEADLGGQGSHGFVRLPFLLRRLDAGLIEARPTMAVQAPRPAAALLDAGNALGPVAALRATELAAERAHAYGIGLVAVRHSNHLGALNHFLRRLAGEGLAGLAFSNTPPAMAPPGAGTPLLGTNPIAAGFPRPGGPPLVIDLATSQVARGRILQAGRAGEPLEEGWALDREGGPTRDPTAAIAGSLAPLGGTKGFALALLVEVLTGVLAGAGVGPGVTGTFSPSDRPSDVGHSFWAIDPEAFGPGFGDRLERLVDELRAAGGRVPGERHRAESERRLREGLDLAPGVVEEMEAATGLRLDG